MPASLIRGRHVLCRVTGPDGVEMLEDGALLQRDGEIVEIGPADGLRRRHPDVPEIGSRDHLVIPGLVNAHHHVGVAHPLLGCLDGPLELWLAEVWARRDVDPYLDTLWGAALLLRSGVTTVMHNLVRWIPPAGEALLEDTDRILRGYREAGLRVAYSVAMKEQNRIVYGDDGKFLGTLPPALADALASRLRRSLSGDGYLALFEEIHRRHAGEAGDRVRLLLSPSNVHWTSDALLQRIKALAGRYGAGIHMHLAETAYQREWALRTVGKTPVAHLRALGVLGPEVSCAHGVWLSDDDLEQMADAGAVICHNPSSNLRLSSGVAPVARMLARGVTVALGADSSGINDDYELLQEVRLASALHRAPGHDSPRLTPAQLLQMATASGARACLLGERVGSLEVGKRADVVLLSLDRLGDRLGASADVPVLDLLVQRGRAEHIDTVLVDGEVVFDGGRCTRIDEAAVATELRRRFAGPLTPAEEERRAIVAALRPHVRAFYADWRPHFEPARAGQRQP
jgi:cytosine/adenosine deaminase-related metal-dependent hydrolase